MLDILDFSKTIVAGAVHRGGIAIDATVGNGHDTLFLAECVGQGGQVHGFDVQKEAIRKTRKRLEEAGCHKQVTLTHADHASMRKVLSDDIAGSVEAVMFNLGYLPGGSDKSLVTQPTSTVAALDVAKDVLRPGGVISIVVYTGHPGGAEEAAAVEGWAAGLEQGDFKALSYRFLNHVQHPPYLVAVEKRSS